MRRPWIKVETATPDKPEICAIATNLRMDEDAVIGKLVRLWSWVEVNHIFANDLGVTKEFLDKLVGRKGFANALIGCGWLSESGGRLGLLNLERHNGGSAKVRALTAQRVALHRNRKQLSALRSVSKSLHNEVDQLVNTRNLNDEKSVKTSNKNLLINEEIGAQTGVEEPTTNDLPMATQPEAIAEELPAKKQRSKTANDPDQPLLF
jgi:hypothetical protein